MSNPFSRREILKFLGVAGTAAALTPFSGSRAIRAAEGANPASGFLTAFTPVRLPHPLPIYTELNSFLPNGTRIPGGMGGEILSRDSDPSMREYTIFDDVVLPPEYERYVILSW